MSIAILRLLLDFGLVVLIWIIQRIIYPSFLHYKSQNLIVWHNIYTSRFSAIVIPLMLGQLAISVYQVFMLANVYTVISLLFIVAIWLSTFLQFVTIHAKISKGIIDEHLLVSLVKKNWTRTILWTLLFIFSFTYCSFESL